MTKKAETATSIVEEAQATSIVEEIQVEHTTETAAVTTPATTPETRVSALAMNDDEFLEAEAIENADDFVGIDRLTIDQKGKEEGAEVGKFYCKNLAQSYNGFPAVVLRVVKSRIMWPEIFKKDNDPLCKSADGITPLTDDSTFTPMADRCEDCAYGKWKRDGKVSIPPRCKEVKDMILLNLEDFTPFIYSVHSTALGATNQELFKLLRGKIRALTIRRKRLGKPPAHTCMFAFDIDTVLKENEAGDAYVPTYCNIQELDDAQIEAMIQAAKSVKDVKIHSSSHQDEDDYGTTEGSGSDDEKTSAASEKF